MTYKSFDISLPFGAKVLSTPKKIIYIYSIIIIVDIDEILYMLREAPVSLHFSFLHQNILFRFICLFTCYGHSFILLHPFSIFFIRA